MEHALPLGGGADEASLPFNFDKLPDPCFDVNGIKLLESRYLIKRDDGTTETPKELLWRVAIFVASAEIVYCPEVYNKNEKEKIDRDPMDDRDVVKHFGYHPLVQDYKIPTGTSFALYRLWRFYQSYARMKKNFRDFIMFYFDNFKEKIVPLAIDYYNMMANGEFLPNTPTLMNAGMEESLLSGCYVLPIQDSMESIFDTIKNAAMIHKAGGGTGFAFSRLRPRGDKVKGREGSASGPVSFMRVFNSATGEVKQGYARRGANMGVLSVHHPDILDFVRCKRPDPDAHYKTPDELPFNNFNISVAATDQFMRAVRTNGRYPSINPRTGKIIETVAAKDIWDAVIDNAWEYGDPGMIFIDTMNSHNPTPEIGDYESTNPCGEQVLLPYESCNLGAINLNKIFDPSKNTKIDCDRYHRLIDLSVRFLNDVSDMNWYPLPEIEKLTRENRKIGLGVMGFADLLYRMGVRYDSDEGYDVAEELAKVLSRKSHEISRILGDERGPFINHGKSTFKDDETSIFNASITTIAPCGTTGLMLGVSGGIEPVFYLKSSRWTYEGHKMEAIHPVFLEKVMTRPLCDDVLKHVKEHGSLEGYEKVIDLGGDIVSVFRTANQIHYKDHIKMQSIWQTYIDSSISKTINMPKDATKEDVSDAYMSAYQQGCKGITVYRDGCKDFQVITVNANETEKEIPGNLVRDLPDVMKSIRYRTATGCGNIYVNVSHDEKFDPVETFLVMGKSGGCVATWADGLGRMISVALRAGVPGEEIIQQLKNIRCNKPLSKVMNGGKEETASCVDAIGNVLLRHIGQLKGTDKVVIKDRENRRGCPECGSPDLVYEENCVKCEGCGWSKC